MRYSQFAFFGELALGGISLFSLAHGSGYHIRVNRLKPRAPIYAYTEHAQFVDLSQFELWRRTVARCNIFHEGLGMSKLFITSRVPIRKKNSALAMMKL